MTPNLTGGPQRIALPKHVLPKVGARKEKCTHIFLSPRPCRSIARPSIARASIARCLCHHENQMESPNAELSPGVCACPPPLLFEQVRHDPSRGGAVFFEPLHGKSPEGAAKRAPATFVHWPGATYKVGSIFSTIAGAQRKSRTQCSGRVSVHGRPGYEFLAPCEATVRASCQNTWATLVASDPWSCHPARQPTP